MTRLSLIMSLLALGISTAAAIGTVAALRRPAESPRAAEAVDTEALEQKVALLTRQMEAVRLGLSVRATTDAPTPAAGAAAPSDLTASLSALSQRLAELEQQTQVARERGQLPGPLSPDAFARATSTALDRSALLRDRVLALRQLRPVNERAEGRTAEVTSAMIEILTAPDTPPPARADVIRNLSGIDHPSLKDPLLALIARDTDSQTRREAVESLLPFYSDPQVLSTISRLKDADPDPAVRREAERRLRQWQEKRR